MSTNAPGPVQPSVSERRAVKYGSGVGRASRSGVGRTGQKTHNGLVRYRPETSDSLSVRLEIWKRD